MFHIYFRPICQASLSGNLEIGRFGMSINGFSGEFNDNIIISAPYAGLGLENYGKLYVFGEERNGGNCKAINGSRYKIVP